MIGDNFRFNMIQHTCAVLENNRNQRPFHAISHVYKSYHLGDEVPPSTAMAFVTRWVRKVNLHHVVQSKWKTGRKTVGTDGELGIIGCLEKG